MSFVLESFDAYTNLILIKNLYLNLMCLNFFKI